MDVFPLFCYALAGFSRTAPFSFPWRFHESPRGLDLCPLVNRPPHSELRHLARARLPFCGRATPTRRLRWPIEDAGSSSGLSSPRDRPFSSSAHGPLVKAERPHLNDPAPSPNLTFRFRRRGFCFKPEKLTSAIIPQTSRQS